MNFSCIPQHDRTTAKGHHHDWYVLEQPVLTGIIVH